MVYLSLLWLSHINNNYAKKRGIGKKLLLTIRPVMLDEQVDLAAGDFNGAAWRGTTNANNISIIEKTFADCELPMASWPTPSQASTNCQSDFGKTAFARHNYDGCTTDKIRQHI